MRKIGITGGIGSGRAKYSTFLSVVRGAVICQSDLVAHQVHSFREKNVIRRSWRRLGKKF